MPAQALEQRTGRDIGPDTPGIAAGQVGLEDLPRGDTRLNVAHAALVVLRGIFMQMLKHYRRPWPRGRKALEIGGNLRDYRRIPAGDDRAARVPFPQNRSRKAL